MSGPVYKRANGFRPDFRNLIKVLEKGKPERPVLFEYALNDGLVERLAGSSGMAGKDLLCQFAMIIKAFENAGYDYATVSAWRTNTLKFPKNSIEEKETHSLNSGRMITDWKSFEEYKWPDAGSGDYNIYEDLGEFLPDGMKLIATGNGGVLENVIDLTGFENLCMMSIMDEELTTQIFDAVGSRLLRFYEIVAPLSTVGACIVNDDWGFKTQTMLSPEMLRRWVFPWHKRMAEAIHKAGKPAILHSCGQLKKVMDDVIYDMNYDAKHSFEDQILPVEDAYDLYSRNISILGGIDLDFIVRSSPEEIKKRAAGMLEKSCIKGGYALGSGNSIPGYVPDEKYLAMISAVNQF